MINYSSSKEFGSGHITKPRKLVTRWRLLFFGPLLVLIGIMALTYLPAQGLFFSVFGWIQVQEHLAWLWVTLFYTAASLFFLPQTIIALSAGFLFGMKTGFLTAFLGCLLGSVPSFFIGRGLARKWIISNLAADSNFRIITDAVKQNGFKIILLCRINPIFPFGLLNYISGATSIRFISYVLASLLGFVPLTLIYVYIGQAAKTLSQAISGDLSMLPAQQHLLLAIMTIIIALTSLTVWVIKRSVK